MKSAKHAAAHDESKTVCNTVKISANEFSEFEFFLNKIKFKFNDFSLVDGAFRSFSNDKSYIIETGFPFFRDVSFDIAKIKQIMKSISTLNKKGSITFKVDDTGISIDDGITYYNFVHPYSDYIDNKFISFGDMEKLVLNSVDPYKLIFSNSINKKLVCRTKQFSRKLASNCIHLKRMRSTSNEVFLVITGKADESAEASINLKNTFLMPIMKGHYLELPAFPFNFDKDHLHIKCYLNYNKKVTTMYSTKVNDIFINIYSQSELFSEDKEK